MGILRVNVNRIRQNIAFFFQDSKSKTSQSSYLMEYHGNHRPTLGPKLALTRPNSPLEIMFKFPYLALTRLNSHYLACIKHIIITVFL